MAIRRKTRRRNPAATIPRRRRRRNPNGGIARRNNPGISGMIMGGVWVGVGMWAGGFIGGIIPRFGSGLVGDLIHGSITAYAVAWVGSRFTRNAGLMAAGAFAPVAMSALSGVLGGFGGIASSITGSIGGGGSKQIDTAPNIAPGANVVQMPTQMVA